MNISQPSQNPDWPKSSRVWSTTLHWCPEPKDCKSSSANTWSSGASSRKEPTWKTESSSSWPLYTYKSPNPKNRSKSLTPSWLKSARPTTSCSWFNCICSSLKSTTSSRTTPRQRPRWLPQGPTPIMSTVSHRFWPKLISCPECCMPTIRTTRPRIRTFMSPLSPWWVLMIPGPSTVLSIWFCVRSWAITRMMSIRCWMVSLVSSSLLIVMFRPSRKLLMPISRHQLLRFLMCSRSTAEKSKEIKLSTTTQNFCMITCLKRTCSRSLIHTHEWISITLPESCL